MEKPVILIIADISGYTRFVASNIETTAHSQIVIRELIETIIRQVEIPLEVAKLEGDAVFLYSVKDDSGMMRWDEKKRKIGEKLITFFEAFAQKLVQLTASTLCECDACKNIESLKLKIIVHSGTAVFQRIGRFDELGGLDPIVVHRLLKNSLQSHEYILMTAAAYNEIEFPGQIKVHRGTERYDDIGAVKTLVYYPTSIQENHRLHLKKDYDATSLSSRFNAALRWSWNLSIESILISFGLKKLQEGMGIRGQFKFLPSFWLGVYLLVTFPFSFSVNALKSYVKLKRSRV